MNFDEMADFWVRNYPPQFTFRAVNYWPTTTSDNYWPNYGEYYNFRHYRERMPPKKKNYQPKKNRKTTAAKPQQPHLPVPNPSTTNNPTLVHVQSSIPVPVPSESAMPPANGSRATRVTTRSQTTVPPCTLPSVPVAPWLEPSAFPNNRRSPRPPPELINTPVISVSSDSTEVGGTSTPSENADDVIYLYSVERGQEMFIPEVDLTDDTQAANENADSVISSTSASVRNSRASNSAKGGGEAGSNASAVVKISDNGSTKKTGVKRKRSDDVSCVKCNVSYSDLCDKGCVMYSSRCGHLLCEECVPGLNSEGSATGLKPKCPDCKVPISNLWKIFS